MTIIKTVNTSELFHDLKAMGRDNFSYEGAKALMECLDEFSDDIGEPIEYDPIAFCCEYSEYESLQDFNEQYNSADPFDSWDEVQENTVVILFKGGAIVQDF